MCLRERVPSKQRLNLLWLNQKIKTLLIVTLLLGSISACVEVRELREDYHAVKLERAQVVEARFKMSAGELSIQGGAKDLMEGYFEYNVDHWKFKK